MSQCRRARAVAMWGSAAACIAFLVLWCITLRYTLVWCHVPASGFGGTKVAAYAGAIGVLHFRASTGASLSPVGWEVILREVPMMWRPSWNTGGGTLLTIVPMWIPASLLSLVAAACWWLGRREPRPGHCRCGYSLTGLAEGAPCPECGARAVNA